MNAQQEWKTWFRSSHIAYYMKDQCRYEMRKIRREAALERIVERQRREIDALNKEIELLNIEVNERLP